MLDQRYSKLLQSSLRFLTLCLCVSVVNSNRLKAQTLSFPATRADQQQVIQVDFDMPLNLRTVCFSTDGKTLYVGGYKQVLVWSLTDAKLAHTITDASLTGMITAMTVSPDGKLLAVSGSTPAASSSPVILIDPLSNNRITSIEQSGDCVMAMAVTNDGKQLAVGTYDGNFTLWDMNTFKQVKNFPQQGYAISDITFDEKDTWLAVSNRGGQVQAFELAEDYPIKINKTMEDAVTSLLFENGKTVNLAIAVGGDKERSVRLLNAKNPRRARKFGGTPDMPLDIAWAPKSKTAYLAGSDGNIVSWARMGRVDKTFKGHSDWVTAIALSPDEKLLASVSLDGTTKIWEASKGLLLATLLKPSPQKNDWLFISSLGYFNASSVELVRFFEQPDAAQSALRKQWLDPKQINEHLGFNAK
ncbi:MAG TPA: hypothetical protein DER01_01960 [Phycisphaerales bacterium]|nr:hypothetical protein [Phycisphaerales bacterium]